jgi:DNA ligase D-like protein (predicted 3'-phosphoesterase)
LNEQGLGEMRTSSKDNLKEYREKRDFRRTQEPSGDAGEPSEQPIFVIQKHDASNLHYDFRLEVDGVLKSWAVPKGPSTDPSEKRLAMPTEDHPLEYADFEGVIPKGEYGAGTVLVWDTGPYRNLRAKKDEDRLSMEQSIGEGKVEVWLEGEKLCGGYALIRTGKGDDHRWLLIKMDDEESDARRNPTSTEPKSVLTGRTLQEIAEEAKGS